MNRVWFIVLAFSVGLNGAFLYDKFMRKPHRQEERAVHVERERGHELHGDSLPHSRADRFLERRLHRLGDELGLTDEQHAAIRKIHEQSMDEIMRMRHDTRAVRDSFHMMMAETEFDSERFRAMGAELHEKQRALESAIMENLIREAELLTPAQRASYQDMMMGPWRHGGRGGPGRRHR